MFSYGTYTHRQGAIFVKCIRLFDLKEQFFINHLHVCVRACVRVRACLREFISHVPSSSKSFANLKRK